jgi:hypothetical protein
MADWINSLPERTLWDAALGHGGVIEFLRSAPTFEGMYSLASIGYRSPEASTSSRPLGERDDRLGHEAMRLLLGLEPAPEILSWISKRIRGTPFEQREELLNAAAQIHATAFLAFLADDAIRRGRDGLRLPACCGSGRTRRVIRRFRMPCGAP